MDGWIMLHRKITEHWIWNDPIKLKWWLDILLSVNHSDEKVNIGVQLIECKRGQSVRSLQTWANRWGVSKSAARNFLELLRKDKMIDMENVSISTRITVCHYEDYQQPTHASKTDGKRMENGWKTDEDPNNNEYNEYNKKNKEKTPFDLVVIDWFDYKKERKESYKTEKSKAAFINKLKRFSGGDADKARQIIDNSMANNWAGIFEPKQPISAQQKVSETIYKEF